MPLSAVAAPTGAAPGPFLARGIVRQCTCASALKPAIPPGQSRIIIPINAMTDERILSGDFREEDASELSLRPQRLAEYIGQDRVKENLRIALQAARQRGEALDHVLLHGPPGLGKTT